MATVVAQRSLASRVLGTFVSPGEVFAEFQDEAPWVGPLIICIVVTALVGALIPGDLFQQQIVTSIQQRGGTVPPNMSTAVGIVRLVAVVSPIIVIPIVVLLGAGILRLIFTTILDGTATYRQYLAVSSHAQLIAALGSLITLPLIIFTGDVQTRLSAALFTPFLPPESALYMMMHGLSVFVLWMLVVTGLGVAVVNRRASWVRPVTIVIVIYLVALVAMSLIRARATGA